MTAQFEKFIKELKTHYGFATQREVSRTWRDVRHGLRKFPSTVKIAFRLVMARTFGEYRHTVFDGAMSYAVYRWRGKWWAIPTSPIEDNAE